MKAEKALIESFYGDDPVGAHDAAIEEAIQLIRDRCEKWRDRADQEPVYDGRHARMFVDELEGLAAQIRAKLLRAP